MTLHRFAQQLVVSPRGSPGDTVCDSKTILKYFVTAASPVCPRCLKEDSTAYERLVWSFRAVPVCVTHRCLLVTRCPACHRSLRCDRNGRVPLFMRRTAAGGPSQEVSSQAIEIARVLERLLMDQPALLPEMSPAATFWWAERLAAAAAKTPAWMECVAKRMDIADQRRPSCFPGSRPPRCSPIGRIALKSFSASFSRWPNTAPPPPASAGDSGSCCARRHIWNEIGYPAPANALRDYLVAALRRGAPKRQGLLCSKGVRTNPCSRKRPWITQTEAARLLRIRGRDDRLTRRPRHPRRTDPSGRAAWTLRGPGLARIRGIPPAELQSALDVCTTARRLGIGRHAVLDLIHADLLSRAVRTAKGWQVPLRSVHDLGGSRCRAAADQGRNVRLDFAPAGHASRRIVRTRPELNS